MKSAAKDGVFIDSPSQPIDESRLAPICPKLGVNTTVLRFMNRPRRLELAMVFDIERHRENRMKFLAVLYESGTEHEAIVGKKAGLSPEDSDRIGTELLDEHLVGGVTGDGVHGSKLTLEPAGRALIEKYLANKSQLAKKATDRVEEIVEKALRPTPVQAFYSYSHEDEKFRAMLETHLKILERQGLIAGWHDRMIGAGEEWKGAIDKNLEEAQLILLLVSASFIASDYCWDIEMKRAIERHDRGAARVIPVILRPCDWHGAPFAKLQALPKNGKPLDEWRNLNAGFNNVTEGIRQVIEEVTGNSSKRLKSESSVSSKNGKSRASKHSGRGLPGIWFALISALPKLKTGIQLVGFTVLVAGFVAYRAVPQDQVPGVIATGGIGLLLLIFGLLLWLISKVKTLQEPKFISTLFAIFCLFILALFLVSVYYLGQSERRAVKVAPTSENPPDRLALNQPNVPLPPPSERNHSMVLRNQDKSAKELLLILEQRHKRVNELISRKIDEQQRLLDESGKQDDNFRKRMATDLRALLTNLKELQSMFEQTSAKLLGAIDNGNWILYHELDTRLFRYFGTVRMKRIFDNGFPDEPLQPSLSDLFTKVGTLKDKQLKWWMRTEVVNDIARVYYEPLPPDLASQLRTKVPSIELFRAY
jgi:hypothetical protein